MIVYRDFKEIAHSGGKMTFDIGCDAEGHIAVAAGWSQDRPVSSAVVGLYAHLNTGLAVADFRIGGVGVPFDPQPPPGTINVMLASDSQMRWGNQCPRCRGYFRSANHPAVYPTTCSYCGVRAPAYAFLTDAQRKYVAHVTDQVASCIADIKPGQERRIVIDMDEAGDREAKEPKPDFYYSEQAQQTEFTCLKCGQYNDVRGRFAYCSACGWKNNCEDLRSKLDGVRTRLNENTLSPAAAVREAVSEFDACCRDFANQIRDRIPMKPARKKALEQTFYDVETSAIAAMKDVADIDMARGFNAADTACLTLMMHRRHVHEHNGSVADKRYVAESGDTVARAGDLLREDKGNAHDLIALLNCMATNLEADFHDIFPPTEWPVKYFNRVNASKASSEARTSG